jgi:hypothetical protein
LAKPRFPNQARKNDQPCGEERFAAGFFQKLAQAK